MTRTASHNSVLSLGWCRCRINGTNEQGGEEPMIVIQLSDPHILVPG
jgi:hypothetical protein